MPITHTTQKIISITSPGLDQSLADELVPILQTLFNNHVVGSELLIQEKRVKSVHAITDMYAATENLDLWIKLYKSPEIKDSTHTPEEDYFCLPPRHRRANASANLIPVTPRKLGN